MGKKKRGLLCLIFMFIGTLLINSFFVSTYINPIQPTGFVSSDGEVSLGISRSTAIIVLRDNFNGNTTDFTVGGNIALETLTNMTLERFGYGKIVFNEVVNITEDAHSPTGGLYDRVVDIDSNLEISRNFILIDEENLTSLNKSVTITLYGLTYYSPKVLRNDIDCPSNICHLISYSGGRTAVFTVSYFESDSMTYYALAETSVTSTPTPPSSGGGGGTIGGRDVPGPNVTAFYVSPDILSIDVEKGKSYLQQVTLYNNGNSDLPISVISSSSISNFIKIDEKSFVLKKGESKIYSFYVYSSVRSKADLYTGKLTFDSKGSKVSVDLAIGVQELPALFDMKISSTKKYVLPGRIASGEIKISNIGDSDSVKAVLEYGVMDFENAIYSSRTENIVVTRDILTKKVSLKLPDEIGIGRYIIYAKVTYDGKIAVSSDTFQVEKISVLMWTISLGMLMILLVLVMIGIILVKRKKEEKVFKNQLALKSQPNLKDEDVGSLVKDLLNELKK